MSPLEVEVNRINIIFSTEEYLMKRIFGCVMVVMFLGIVPLLAQSFGGNGHETGKSLNKNIKGVVMKGYKANIEKSTLENNNFRKVLYTAKHMQLILMSLKPGEEIGAEIHKNSDQFFRFEGGSGKCIIDGNEYQVKDGDVIIVPAGAEHNVINTRNSIELKMYTIYALPNHQDGIVRATKKDAETNKEEFDGKTTE
jgi:mannose-6-phosphate isomerase-like protein (cupin superfamily)